MSAIFATQLSAVASLVLAVGAIVTACFAVAAFRAQSQEVRAVEQQVADQQELKRQQAELIKIQSGQLELQAQQLNDQRRINNLQVEDLRASLEERARQRQVAEREQADKVALRMSFVQFPNYSLEDVAGFDVVPGDEVHMAVVSDESRRPIQNVVCNYGGTAVMVGRLVEQQPDSPGEPAMLVGAIPESRARVIRAGETYGFVFEMRAQRVLLGGGGEARFTDDAGLDWQLGEDLHLTKLDNRDDW